MQRPQKTSVKEDSSGEQKMESGDNRKVRSIASVRDDRLMSEQSNNTLFNQVLTRENLNIALKRVMANNGAPGIDNVTCREFREHLIANWQEIKQRLLCGTYQPQPVKRVEIPKPDGGIRSLEIPILVDRLIQQAIAQILTPIYERKFSDSSYGFRPGRNAHQAVRRAREYIEAGYKWVVDIDLEKFFDRVNHDVLMSLLSKEINDQAVLRLIRKFLESGVMINGVVTATEVGTPQGGPLSPLLSNIMLDVLDDELEKRGHKFCRYADDCNIYVRSERAGKRVIKSVRKFIENRLRLRINAEKSAVANPADCKFLGFTSYTKTDGTIGIKLSVKSRMRLKTRLKEMTARSNGDSITERIKRLNRYLMGWLNYYMPADIKTMLNDTLKWLRRRIRMCLWKSWKNIKCRYDNLRKLGLNDDYARKFANSRKGYWRIAGSHILSRTVTNRYITNDLGLIDIVGYYLKLRNA